jgi:hypothetical protein
MGLRRRHNDESVPAYGGQRSCLRSVVAARSQVHNRANNGSAASMAKPTGEHKYASEDRPGVRVRVRCPAVELVRYRIRPLVLYCLAFLATSENLGVQSQSAPLGIVLAAFHACKTKSQQLNGELGRRRATAVHSSRFCSVTIVIVPPAWLQQCFRCVAVT